MQKLTEVSFFCYPKNQDLNVLYADVSVLNTRLFKALSLQISAKEGVMLRFRKTYLGHQLSKLLQSDKVTFKIPENSNVKIVYKNSKNLIFFEFDKNNNPIYVLKKTNHNVFNTTKFLGYTLLENYTLKEFLNKKETIKLVLTEKWNDLISGECLHGDFTHFNILLSKKNDFYFIDQKKVSNSVLFDHFYFYSYYMQCLQKCKTIKTVHVLKIKHELQKIILDICKSFINQHHLQTLNTQHAVGLSAVNRVKFLKEFVEIFS